MMFKIITRKLFVDPLDFFGVALTRTRGGKLTLLVPIARTQIRTKFLTYRNIKEFNLMLAAKEQLIGFSLPAFKRFISLGKFGN